MGYRVAVVGATGNVGREFLQLLAERKFPADDVVALASEKSAGRKVSFGEDENRTRDTNAGANLGVIRRVAASLLKQDPGKGSIKAKRLNAALDEKYLLRALQGFKAN